jgi:hypothetical protein
LASALYWTAHSVAFVQEILHGAIALLFLLGPSLASRLSGRPFDQQRAGLGIAPLGLNLRVLGLVLLITWPLFLVGFFGYYGVLCAPASALRELAIRLAPVCPHWHGLTGARLRLPDGFLTLALSQIIVVAIPEEFFFRGYLMARLEERWPSRRRLAGAAVGWPLLASSLMFGIGHFLVDFQPGRLAVFFPALVFGWMRARTGSLAPGAAFHALCNMLSEVLHTSLF